MFVKYLKITFTDISYSLVEINYEIIMKKKNEHIESVYNIYFYIY